MQWSTNMNTLFDTLQWISPVLGTEMSKNLIEERVGEELISEVLLLPNKRTYMKKMQSHSISSCATPSPPKNKEK